jgi:hypothetical protein
LQLLDMKPSKMWQSYNIWERHQQIKSEYVKKRLTAGYIRRNVSVWNLLSFALVRKDTWIKICESISLSFILYGCKTWFRRLWKIGVRAFKNRVLRRICVRKNEKQHDSGDNWITESNGDHLFLSPNFIRGITSRRTRGAGKSKGKIYPRTGLEGPERE